MVARDGSLSRHVLTIGGTLYDEFGVPVRQLGVSMDITERLRAEQEMRETLQRLRLAKDAADIGVWSWDLGDDIWTGMIGCAGSTQ